MTMRSSTISIRRVLPSVINKNMHMRRCCFSSSNIKPKTALVTGGNRGIGLQMCKQFAEMDMNVIMGVRDVQKGQDAIQSLFDRNRQHQPQQEPHHTKYEAIDCLKLDISDSFSIIDAAEYVRTHYDSIDILINNAGVGDCKGSYAKKSKYSTAEIFATNYFGTIETTQALLPMMTNNTERKMSDYLSRIICSTNRDSALHKLSEEKRRRFLASDLTHAELDALMNQYLTDFAASGVDIASDAARHEFELRYGWIADPYLMTNVGLNMYARVLAASVLGVDVHNDVFVAGYCPGHCASDFANHFGTRDTQEAAHGAVTLSTMYISNDENLNGKWFAAFYMHHGLESVEMEVMDWVHPQETMSWNTLLDEMNRAGDLEEHMEK